MGEILFLKKKKKFGIKGLTHLNCKSQKHAFCDTDYMC